MQIGLRLITFLCFVFLFHSIRSQDIIYLNNGSKFDATVKELSADVIKYKNFTNPDGPTYVIAKKDVLFIEYKNGTIDIINKNPVSVSPIKTETVAPRKEVKKPGPNEIYYLNKNCILLNGAALANSVLTLLFDREFYKSRFSVTALYGYNFNLNTTYTNRFIQTLANSKKNYDVGFGVNYYTQTRKKSQFFIGCLIKYMNYNYVRQTYVESIINGTPITQIQQQNVQSYQLAAMAVNGIQIRVTPTFTYRMFIGYGFTNRNSDLSKAVKENPQEAARSFAKAYIGMCVGYRFY